MLSRTAPVHPTPPPPPPPDPPWLEPPGLTAAKPPLACHLSRTQRCGPSNTLYRKAP